MMRNNPPDTNSLLLLPPRQAAQALATSPRKLWEMAFDERSAPIYGRLRRGIRYMAADLERWVEAHKRKGGHER